MKRLAAVAAFLFLACTCRAQNRFYVLGDGGVEFSNSFIGLEMGAEIPFAKRFEIDTTYYVAPNRHTSLGNGWTSQTMVNGLFWLRPNWALTGGAEHSGYVAGKTKKTGEYMRLGISRRAVWGGTAVRFDMNYLREFDDGIVNGIESSHLQGGVVSVKLNFGCKGVFCFREESEFEFGRVLTQGNPVCDGTYGTTGGPNNGPCWRTPGWGGGSALSFGVEFPRRYRGQDYMEF
jgi:hypothetical protein